VGSGAARGALALIVVVDADLVGEPPQRLPSVDEGVLAPRTLGMALDLGGMGLADVDQRRAGEMAGLDFGVCPGRREG
jgi:hypothetical protein